MEICQKLDRLAESNLAIKKLEENQNSVLGILHLTNTDTYNCDEMLARKTILACNVTV